MLCKTIVTLFMELMQIALMSWKELNEYYKLSEFVSLENIFFHWKSLKDNVYFFSMNGFRLSYNHINCFCYSCRHFYFHSQIINWLCFWPVSTIWHIHIPEARLVARKHVVRPCLSISKTCFLCLYTGVCVCVCVWFFI